MDMAYRLWPSKKGNLTRVSGVGTPIISILVFYLWLVRFPKNESFYLILLSSREGINLFFLFVEAVEVRRP